MPASSAQLNLRDARPALGHKMRCEARDVQPGDFTTFSGYRRVVAVRPASGKRRRFVRVDGSTETVPRNQLLTVYRHG